MACASCSFRKPTKSTVTLNITDLVGSRHEGSGGMGTAHLLEHLMFKGTPTPKNVPQALTQRGARSNGAREGEGWRAGAEEDRGQGPPEQ